MKRLRWEVGGISVYADTRGDKGNTFLKLGQGARAIGMGEAYVTVSDDISSLYWNPLPKGGVYNDES